MADTPAWTAIGLSIASGGWTGFVYWQSRREARRAAAERRASESSRAILAVVASWTVTRLGRVTVGSDPDIFALKESSRQWRMGCKGALAVLPASSQAGRLIVQTVEAADQFEGLIDKYVADVQPRPTLEQLQDALTHLQRTVNEGVPQLVQWAEPGAS